MKRSILCITLALCFLLSACSNAKVLTKTESGDLYNKMTGDKYVACSVSLKAYSIDTSKVYAKVGSMKYYRIRFENPEEFISEEDNVMGGVYRISTMPEITPENFGAIAAHIYIIGTAEYVVDQFQPAEEYLADTSYDFENYTDGTEYVEAVVEAMLEGEAQQVPEYIDDDETRRIRLLSNKYPGLMYEIIFMKATTGKSYLYDRGTGVCVLAPEKIVDRLL